MQMKGRTLSLNEGKLLTSDVLIATKETQNEEMEMKPTASTTVTNLATEEEVPNESEPWFHEFDVNN